MWDTLAIQRLAEKRILQDASVQQVLDKSGGKFSFFFKKQEVEKITAKGVLPSVIIVNQ